MLLQQLEIDPKKIAGRTGYIRCNYIHVKRGRQTLRLNGSLEKHNIIIEEQTVDYINIESENQKSSPIFF